MKKIKLILMCMLIMMFTACTDNEPIEDEPEKEVKEKKEDIKFSDKYQLGRIL